MSYNPTRGATALAGYFDAFAVADETVAGFIATSLSEAHRALLASANSGETDDADAWLRWRELDALLDRYGSLGETIATFEAYVATAGSEGQG